jgi:predicted DNA-binding transcriptional regulator YafY
VAAGVAGWFMLQTNDCRMQPNCIAEKFEKNMPTTKNPVTRYRLIDECLQLRHRAWPAQELRATVADKFFELTGCKLSPRQFAQDLADMREGGSTGYNAPIEWNRERGYHYTDPEFSIRNSPLVSEDMGVLRQALAMLQQFQGLGGLGDELHELAKRVEGHLQAQAQAAPVRQIIWFDQVPDYVGTKFLGLLYQAIRMQQVLEMKYRPFGAAQTLDSIVHPYLLKQYNHGAGRFKYLCFRPH